MLVILVEYGLGSNSKVEKVMWYVSEFFLIECLCGDSLFLKKVVFVIDEV